MFDVSSMIARFAPISLDEMEGVALQSRMDTKYLVGETELPGLLGRLVADYRLLETETGRGTLYRTLYYDTPERRFYRDHHNGRTFRSKVRMREYVGSGTCFLEVKQRTGRGGTRKRRVPVAAIGPVLSPAQAAFVADAIGSHTELQPVVRNEFFRYTLVHRTRKERLTLDLRLQFSSGDGTGASIPGLCVAELKEADIGHGSPFTALVRALPAPPSNFSKYCIGTVLLNPGVKYNNFKAVLLRAHKVAHLPAPTFPV
ncbi:MAG TPA: polyphosphate polymerase domain-containing protein [Flavobacteriales bacterium]|nr:polyphosphate polymerase domain-containing protein [Flavobacteriales bacterium]HRP81783.1 polyphosphate polymerase domain-containing protein [Flavobacteriales bacterium]HRQ83836.1 polyphosphate polymerase domain-containing protein [Flavobacteriales bacterium]